MKMTATDEYPAKAFLVDYDAMDEVTAIRKPSALDVTISRDGAEYTVIAERIVPHTFQNRTLWSEYKAVQWQIDKLQEQINDHRAYIRTNIIQKLEVSK